MQLLRGVYRIIVTLLALCVLTITVLSTAWLPIEIKGARLSAWPTVYFSRFIIRFFRIHVTWDGAEKLAQHNGFVFPNHVSFLDVLLLAHIFPVRFLSKLELRRWPLIGWVAWAIGTVFVDRSQRTSRQAARLALATIPHYPPVVLFPEGGILPPPDAIKPFRYGAFEIAYQGKVPYYPCVLVYEPLDVLYWGDEALWTAVWRFVTYTGPLSAEVHLLPLVKPRADDDPQRLALTTHGAMEAVLNYARGNDDVLKAGL